MTAIRNMHAIIYPRTALFLACVLQLIPSSRVLAGGSPEGVFLVINANSSGSKEIGNHYAKLRNLPAGNIVYLDYKGDLELITGDQFREQILLPTLRAINQRGISIQIDTICYSSDFPWQVDLRKDFHEKLRFSPQQKPVASLTGATFLAQFVLTKSPVLVTQAANRYAPTWGLPNHSRCQKLGPMKSHGFRGWYAWEPGGKLSKDLKTGHRYLLSTMLGVTTGRGNSIDEVIESMKRSVQSEQTPTQGTFYYVKNGGIRSTTRHSCFAEAVDSLQKSGADAKIVDGNVPPPGSVVTGLMTGAGKVDPSRLRIVPGAICEHLTSSGGDLRDIAHQTPLSDWIRAGATGTSGTVEEPFAVQAKFPLPSLHLHYHRGCSMAESYYQSVAAPYQLLIVGDPLCQPWAQRPEVEVQGWPEHGVANWTLKTTQEPSSIQATEEPEADRNEATSAEGEASQVNRPVLSLRPFVKPALGSGQAIWELYVDGKLNMRLPSGKLYDLRQDNLGPGWHELRCVGANPDPIETRGVLSGEINIPLDWESEASEPVVSLSADRLRVKYGQSLRVSCLTEQAEKIVVLQNSRVVAEIAGHSGQAQIDSKLLGRGPVRLQAKVEPLGALSEPMWIAVE